jgi:hypothetical protein
MGTAIVSMALSLDGWEVVSRILLVVAAGLWLGYVGVGVQRLVCAPTRLRQDASTPGALTLVAGTAVLGSRLLRLGWELPALAALVAAALLWAALVPRVLRAWNRPTVGASFVLAVSTEALAVLAANSAIVAHETWLGIAAAVFLLLGLGAYAFVLASFDLRQLRIGRGDHWVAGGALAIATVACDRTADATAALPALHALHGPLADGAIALWIAAALWLPLLLAGEVLTPRPTFDARRWSTVFPFGMYAVCSFRTGEATAFGGPATFARAWIWAAVALWLVVAVGMLRRGAAIARDHPAQKGSLGSGP